MSFGFGLSFPAWATLSGRIAAFSPASLFSSGEQGAWYDPSDTTTLFQDSAGTTPVTAVEQPVGLILDKSKGLVLGSELAAAANISTNWSQITGSHTFAADDSAVKVTCTSTGIAQVNLGTVAVGKFYAVSYQIRVSAAATVPTSFTSITTGPTSVNVTATAYETRTGYFSPSSANAVGLRLTLDTGEEAWVRSISVRELPGNHAYQTDPLKRPLWSSRVNLLERTEEFENAAWGKFAGSITANATVAPDGTTTAALFTENTANAQHFLRQNAFIPNGNVSTVSVFVKPNNRRYISFTNQAVTAVAPGVVFDLQDGVVVSAVLGLTGTIQASTNGFYRCTISGTITNESAFDFVLSLMSDATTITYTGDGTSGIYIWGADLRVANESNALPPYQRVVTATDYDTTGFPAFLRFDGSNDALVTNSIDFSTGATNPPLGPDLVVNGDFDDGTNNWTAQSATIAEVGGRLEVTIVVGASNCAFQAVSTVPGRSYKVSYSTYSGTSTAIIRAGTTIRGSDYFSLLSPGENKSQVILATSTTMYVSCLVNGITVGQTAYFDNIAVEEFDANYLPDRMSVFAGVRKLSDVSTAMLLELSATLDSNNGTFYVTAPRINGVSDYLFASKGTTSRDARSLSTYVAPITNVLTGLGDISGDSATLRLNAEVAATNTLDQGTGNFGNYPLNIGSRNNGASLPFNGRLFSLVVLGRGVTPTELTQTEGYVESKTFGKDMAYVFYEVLNGPDGDQLTVTAGGDDLYVYKQYE